jgi:hypothetical protein
MTDIAQRPIWARRTPLDLEDAKQRTTAYVYGNLLVLAAILSVTEGDVDSNRAFWIVLGTAISTFVAHVFAEAMGAQVRSTARPTLLESLALAKESLPVLTSGGFPAVILLLGYWDVLSNGVALAIAEALVLIRIAGTGVIVARLRNERSSLRLLLAGVAVAAVGLLISLLKVYLTH